MPEHKPEGCAWCSALDHRNAALKTRRAIVAMLVGLALLIGWELTRQ